jgi:formylglycine-generating enzyme required for sulfatase activity
MANFDLFISHSSTDHETAASIVTDLEARGIRCWIAPRNIPGGRVYQTEILKALESCPATLLLFSGAASKSEHVLREIELAVQDAKKIYPLRIDATPPGGGLRYLLVNRQWVERRSLGNRLAETIIELMAADGLAVPAVAVPVAAPGAPASAPPPKPSKLVPVLAAVAAIVAVAGVAIWFAVRPPPIVVDNTVRDNPPTKDQATKPGPVQSQPQPQPPANQPAATGAEVIEPLSPVASVAPANSAALGAGVHLFRDCPDCPIMAVIPAGQGVVGSPPSEPGHQPSEAPQQQITIAKPFAVGRAEVSFDEWLACVAEGGCHSYRPGDYGWGYGKNPAINVSWSDAQAYVDWLSTKTGAKYRLLSEAEWEYAARGCASACASTAFWFGQTIAPERANYDWRLSYEGSARAQALRRTIPVDRGASNPFGLVQVAGNVSEWVQDCWNDTLAGLSVDGTARTSGDCQRRVVRGGSWSDEPKDLRSAARGWELATERRSKIGFRITRVLER